MLTTNFKKEIWKPKGNGPWIVLRLQPSKLGEEAELRLAQIIFRPGNGEIIPTTVSEKEWRQYNGYRAVSIFFLLAAAKRLEPLSPNQEVPIERTPVRPSWLTTFAEYTQETKFQKSKWLQNAFGLQTSGKMGSRMVNGLAKIVKASGRIGTAIKNDRDYERVRDNPNAEQATLRLRTGNLNPKKITILIKVLEADPNDEAESNPAQLNHLAFVLESQESKWRKIINQGRSASGHLATPAKQTTQVEGASGEAIRGSGVVVARPKSESPIAMTRAISISSDAEPSQYIRVQLAATGAFSNLLLRWGLHRRRGIVFIQMNGDSSYILKALSWLESEVSLLPHCTLPRRIWGRASPAVMLDGTAARHLRAWSEHQIFAASSLKQFSAGAARLGFIFDNFQDFSPASLQRLGAWIKSLNDADRAWKPLVFVVHNLPGKSATSILGLPMGADHLRIMDEPRPTDEVIKPTRAGVFPGKRRGLYGVAKLWRLAERGPALSIEQQTAIEPLVRWFSTRTDLPDDLPEEDLPFPAGMAVLELESIETKTAESLGRILSDWLARFRPSLAPAFVEAMAGSESSALRLAALESVLNSPALVDVWVNGLASEKRAPMMDEASEVLPRSLYPISAGWCRRILLGRQAEAEPFCAWVQKRLPADVARVAVAVIRREPDLLAEQLRQFSPRMVFDWLRLIGPCLDLPLNRVPEATRGRPEFWRLVESIGATPAHLSRLFALPPEDRAILGFCLDDQWSALKHSPSLQRIRRLRDEP